MDIIGAIVTLGGFISLSMTIIKVMDNKRKIHPKCKEIHEEVRAHLKKNTDNIRTLDQVKVQMSTIREKMDDFKEDIRSHDTKIDIMTENTGKQAIKITEITTTLTHINESLQKIATKLDC